MVVWQTGSYAGHTPQPPWAAHSHPPSPHQPPLHTTPTHKCLGCSPYCVHQSAGGCRPAVAPCRWGGGGCGVVMARLLVATSSVQPTSPWQDRTPCTTTHTHHTHKLGNFRSWHGEDQGSHAVGSGRVGRGAERRGWVKHGSPTWSVFEMCGGVELAAAKKPAKMVGTLRAVATPRFCSPFCNRSWAQTQPNSTRWCRLWIWGWATQVRASGHAVTLVMTLHLPCSCEKNGELPYGGPTPIRQKNDASGTTSPSRVPLPTTMTVLNGTALVQMQQRLRDRHHPVNLLATLVVHLIMRHCSLIF